jgi:NADPH-dependent 2,4-dienoyl-CoA reductase/sulfur reductase-like enzyme
LTLRDREDAERLREELRPGRRVTVIGGGFVGLEVAATATALGAQVTVVEAAPTLLARVLGPEAGAWFAGFHRRHGVQVHAGTTATPRADVTVAAIGVTPATGWLRPAPHVHMAGDAAGHHHWEAAARGGAAAARAMLGLPAAPEPPASFWSDQHGVRIQLVGDTAGADRSTTDRSAEDDFATTFFRGPVPVAVLLVGRPRALPEARRLVTPPERKAA